MSYPQPNVPQKPASHSIPEVGYAPLQYGYSRPQQNTGYPLQNPPVQPVYAPVTPSALVLPPQYAKNVKTRRTVTITLLAVGFVILSILFGGTALLGGEITFFLALIPLTGIVLSTIWIGKWDPEPVFMRILVFLWGAVGSVVLTLIVGQFFALLPGMQTQLASLSIQAPILEEFFKAVFILVLALWFRKYFSGPIDGIVYVMLAAAGFAFTENILYFIQSAGAGGVAALGMTFLLRAIMSPFAHPLFSLSMGIMLGLAVEQNAGKWRTLLYFIVGYLPSVILHALWNGSSYLINDTMLWFVYYLVFQIPIFIGAIILVVKFRKDEAQRTYRALTAYAWQGWFTKEEIETLGTWEGRKYAKQWAKSKNTEAQYVVNVLNKDVVSLSNIKYAIEAGNTTLLPQEEALLKKIWDDKSQMLKL